MLPLLCAAGCSSAASSGTAEYGQRTHRNLDVEAKALRTGDGLTLRLLTFVPGSPRLSDSAMGLRFEVQLRDSAALDPVGPMSVALDGTATLSEPLDVAALSLDQPIAFDFERSARSSPVELEGAILLTFSNATWLSQPPLVERLRGTLQLDELRRDRARGVLEAFVIGLDGADGVPDEELRVDPLFDVGVRVAFPFDVAVEP